MLSLFFLACGVFVFALGVWGIIFTWRKHRESRRILSGRCGACGYSLQSDLTRCSECGEVKTLRHPRRGIIHVFNYGFALLAVAVSLLPLYASQLPASSQIKLIPNRVLALLILNDRSRLIVSTDAHFSGWFSEGLRRLRAGEASPHLQRAMIEVYSADSCLPVALGDSDVFWNAWGRTLLDGGIAELPTRLLDSAVVLLLVEPRNLFHDTGSSLLMEFRDPRSNSDWEVECCFTILGVETSHGACSIPVTVSKVTLGASDKATGVWVCLPSIVKGVISAEQQNPGTMIARLFSRELDSAIVSVEVIAKIGSSRVERFHSIMRVRPYQVRQPIRTWQRVESTSTR